MTLNLMPKQVGYRPINHNPHVVRDITVTFCGMPYPDADAVLGINDLFAEELVQYRLVDAYEADGTVTRTYRLVFQKEGTYTAQEIRELVGRAEAHFKSFGHKIK